MNLKDMSKKKKYENITGIWNIKEMLNKTKAYYNNILLHRKWKKNLLNYFEICHFNFKNIYWKKHSFVIQIYLFFY